VAKIALWLSICGACCGHGAFAENTAVGEPTSTKCVDEIARAAMAESPIVGMSIGVSFGGAPVFTRGYGSADVEDKIPATAETAYHFDSITKNITAAAVMSLSEEGKLRLDDKIGDFIAAFRSSEVRVRRLLNHTSGIKSYTSIPAFEKEHATDLGPDAIIKLIQSAQPDFPPGTSWRYNNSGFYLLGLIIEKASGMKYNEFVATKFFRPLKMSAAVASGVRPRIDNLALGYTLKEGKPVRADAISWTPVFSGGAVCGNVTDLLRWQAALEAGRVVSSAETMRRPTTLRDGTSIDYGFGTRLGAIEGHRCYGHTGGGGGFANVLVSLPDDHLVVVVLKNTEGAVPSTTIAARIVRAILKLPSAASKDLPLSSEEMARYAGTFDSDDGAIEAIARENQLWGRSVGSSGQGTRMRYQGDGIFALGEESIVRFWPRQGKAQWGMGYEGGLFIGAARRVR
jgi:D-alanyl-D-alanine carboxypeptidase